MLRKIFDRYQETFPKSPTSMAINLIATFIFIYSLTIIKDHNIPDVYAAGKGNQQAVVTDGKMGAYHNMTGEPVFSPDGKRLARRYGVYSTRRRPGLSPISLFKNRSAGGKGYVVSYFPQDERPSALPETNCRPSRPIIFPISVKETFQ